MTVSPATSTSSSASVSEDRGSRRSRWPLLGSLAGLGSIVATLALDLHPTDWDMDDPYTSAVVDDVIGGKGHASVIVGYVVVALLLVLAAAWRRHVEPRTLTSTAARVVPLAMTAAAGALSLGYGWRGAMGLYSGQEEGAFDQTGMYIYFVLNDFGAFIGHLGLTIAAGAIAWMAFRERLVSRWIGVVSVLAVLPVVITVSAFGLPGFPGVISGLWLIVTFTGLAFGRSTITR